MGGNYRICDPSDLRNGLWRKDDIGGETLPPGANNAKVDKSSSLKTEDLSDRYDIQFNNLCDDEIYDYAFVPKYGIYLKTRIEF